MRCPRCGSENEHDISKFPCTRCDLLVKMPERNNKPSQQSSFQAPSNVPFVQRSPGSRVSHQSQFVPQTLFPDHVSNPFFVQYRSQSSASHAVGSVFPHAITPLPQTPQQTNEESLVGMQRTLYSLSPSVVPITQSPVDSEGKNAAFAHHLSQKLENMIVPNEPLFLQAHALLTPGTLLRGGRYRLQDRWSHQEWKSNVYEVTWLAQDAHRGGAQVIMCELSLPESASVSMQSMLRTATIALTSIGRHPHVPMLWDAFSDMGKSFFVFEPAPGETLLERMQRTGRAISEQSVVEMGLQVLDILDVASQQMPPLVHGLIRPSHIVENVSEYVLTTFSIVLAGRATQLVTGMDPMYRSPYFSPEFVKGEIDARSDLYALVATMYHTATGSIPDEIHGEIPQAVRLNPTISLALNALLAKGLHPLLASRFQTPAELRQALLALYEQKEPRRTRTDATDALLRLNRPTPIQSLLSTQEAPAIELVREPDMYEGKVQRSYTTGLSDTVLDDERRINRITFALIIGILFCLLMVLTLWYFLH